MKDIFITCIHDRHTDDVYKAFATEQAAKDYLLEIQKSGRFWQDADENMQYGDWCLYVSDDYYMFVQKIEMML